MALSIHKNCHCVGMGSLIVIFVRTKKGAVIKRPLSHTDPKYLLAKRWLKQYATCRIFSFVFLLRLLLDKAINPLHRQFKGLVYFHLNIGGDFSQANKNI